MYSLALIIVVVSEKKAFEHFPIGYNVNLCPAMAAILDFRSAISSFFSETTGPIGTKLSRNVPWMVLYKVTIFRSSRIFNMATTSMNKNISQSPKLPQRTKTNLNLPNYLKE
jgi:hypothetical protein